MWMNVRMVMLVCVDVGMCVCVCMKDCVCICVEGDFVYSCMDADCIRALMFVYRV